MGNNNGSGIPRFDGGSNQDVNVDAAVVDKVDGSGNKTLNGNKQSLMILDKVDGNGSHTFNNFGDVEIKGKIDGFGTRTFRDCSSLELKGKKDGGIRIFVVTMQLLY
jgi:hypothetical protein